jgi:DNA-binding IclR family transcriptional regulator
MRGFACSLRRFAAPARARRSSTIALRACLDGLAHRLDRKSRGRGADRPSQRATQQTDEQGKRVDYTVDAVDKAIGLLNLVAQFPDLGVTELAKRSGNTKARAFRLLGTLELNGLVQRDANAAYRLGNHVLYLGAAAKEQLSIVRVSAAIFEDMVRECNEGIQIRIREGTDSVCIARRDSTHEVRSLTAVGNRRPLYIGASGKLLLAHASPEVREAVLGGELIKYTPTTITSRRTLEKELQKILKDGVSLSLGERSADLVAVAAPVRDGTGGVIAALGISGPSSRMNADTLDSFVDCVKRGADRLSRELGYRAA